MSKPGHQVYAVSHLAGRGLTVTRSTSGRSDTREQFSIATEDASYQSVPVNAPVNAGRDRQRGLATRLARGFTLGVLVWVAGWHLPLLIVQLWAQLALDPKSLVLAAGGGMALAAGLRSRRIHRVLWWLVGLASLTIFLIGVTPLSRTLGRDLIRRDPLQRADAIYVLGPSALSDGTLTVEFQINILHAYELIHSGYASHLVVPRVVPPALPGVQAQPMASALPALQRQMHAFHIQATVEEVGPVVTTVDEARQVARLVRERGWKRVIVVSWPTHMRRVHGVFTKAGVAVICSPGPDAGMDPNHMSAPDRCAAFQGWLHEELGYWLYRRRGWAD